MTRERTTIEPLSLRRDIIIKRLHDTDLEFILEDADEAAIDISADTVNLHIYIKPGGTLFKKYTNTTGNHTTPATGITTFTIAKEDVDAQTPISSTDATLLYYEVERVVGGAGAEILHFEGDLVIQPVADV